MKASLLLCAVIFIAVQSSLALPHYGDDSKIYVHIVPHTHDDVGWLKTVDEYYYGANKTVQLNAAVQYILDTVVQELQLNENRTFIYVEIAFFSRWWNEQDESTKNVVKQLVAKKQLEFVNAGWCMNDEASTHYNAIIDQMTLGLQFVEKNFGSDARPRVAWHIDPFGHSSAMASLLAQMGFDAFFFARNDYDDYKKRVNESTLQMVWRPSAIEEGSDTDLFTGILYNGYGPPHGFCFDHRCSDEPVQDNPDLLGYNVDELVDKFIAAITDQKKHYLTNHIMLTMGSDFQYENAREVYKNLDKLMKYTMMKDSSIELFYSTPSRYIDALHQANIKWTVKIDDFFPYADEPYAYWTGYFTSRPALKGYVRELNGLLQVCKQMDAFSQILGMKRRTTSTTRRLKEAMGVSQHHDAVSGTERQHVADDYALRLHRGSKECQALIQDVIGTVITSNITSSFPAPKMIFCEYLNVSICPEVEKENSFNVLVYNPLLIPAPLILWIPLSVDVATSPLTVEDDKGVAVLSQIQTISLAVQNAKRNRGGAKYELAFGDTLPPLTFKTYFIRPLNKMSSAKKPVSVAKETNINNEHDDIVIGTKPMQVTIDGISGRIKAINNTVSNVAMALDQDFRWYESSIGYNVNSSQASGAYIFRPNGTQPHLFTWYYQVHDQTIVKGDLYTEYRQQFNETSFQTIRVYNHLPYVEFDYVVGPIYKKDSVGKEIVSRFTTDMLTDETWYTDSNGREMQKRVRNYRPTWKLNNTEPVSQNYYPVNSRIFMRDERHNTQFTVFTDRSQGGTSLNDGQLELMVHRRTVVDDHRGVAEPINEPGQFGDGLIIRGRHYVLFDTIDRSSTLNRTMGEYFMLRPHPIFILNQDKADDYKKKFATSHSFLNPKQLPQNVHLLTLEVMTNDKYLIRFENFQESFGPANMTLSNLFMFEITSVVELVLSGNADAPIQRMKWETIEKQTKPLSYRAPVKGPKFEVILNPMEIRTFQIST